MRSIKRYAKEVIYSYLPSSTALMFHHIDDGKIFEKSKCKLDLKKFIEILDSGTTFISMDEYLKFKYAKNNPCTITFDDGLSDAYYVAYPELKKRNIPFTIFVVTEFVDQEGYLKREELRRLAKDPLVTVGSHGLTHMILKGMRADRQKEELWKSKRILQYWTEQEIRCFAYSHGQYDEKTLNILRHEGYYDYAFCAGGGVTNYISKRSRFTLPRMNCENKVQTFKIELHKGLSSLVPEY